MFDATCIELVMPGYSPQFYRNTTEMCTARAALSGFTFFLHPIG